MVDRDDVCVLVPTWNEAETIGDVLDGFVEDGFEHLLVVDGDSSDGTPHIASERGARVVQQSGEGKGQAVREGVELVEQQYVLVLDGDSTYRPDQADRFLEALEDGHEHVIGNRFADMEPGAMTRLNKTGNRLMNRLFAAIHGRNLKDILSGYRAFTRGSFERFRLDADGFGIETELAVECVRHGVSTEVVPITYRSRPGASETNLHPIADGGRIILTLYALARTNNPIFYFGSVASLGLVGGSGVGFFVGYRYLTDGVSHDVLALLSVFLVLLSVQLLMFGVLTDILVSVTREQTRRLDDISDRLDEPED